MLDGLLNEEDSFRAGQALVCIPMSVITDSDHRG